MRTDIENLLNTCLEIEGLLCLVSRRGDGCPGNLISLLHEKAATLTSAIDTLGAAVPSHAEDEDESAFFPIAEEIPKEAAQSVCIESGRSDNVVELMPETVDSSPIEEAVNPSDHGEAPVTVCFDEPTTAQTTEAVSEKGSANKRENVEAIPSTISESHITTRNDKAAVELTINDKFRFRRELFSNNDAELTDALRVASEMASADEVEDYFYNDLCFDAESEVVKDFIRVVTSRFSFQ